MNILNQFTYRTLKKSKTRTLVTIIGIALSVSMFTAVVAIIPSVQQYRQNVETATNGKWEGRMKYSDQESVSSMEKESEVKESTRIADLGYAKITPSIVKNIPYVYVVGIQDNFTEFSPIILKQGRMPRNSSEMVITTHLHNIGGTEFKIGATVKLKLGQRAYATGENEGVLIGGQNVRYQKEDSGGEKLVQLKERTYTVVGICNISRFEEFSGPGFTAYTLYDEKETAVAYDLMMTFHNPSKSEQLLEESGSAAYSIHDKLLHFQGRGLDTDHNVILYGMGAILMGIIMIGSISLIYNSFSISVSERTKQFGLLKSIGATGKQIQRSILFEAVVLSVIGIPLGLVAGVGGILITLDVIGGYLNFYFRELDNVSLLNLMITWQSVIIIFVIGFITVLISAMIPARKAVRLTAMQAIRQSEDIRIRHGEVKISKFSYRLFGFEAMLARKNFRRNRKRYRATMFSLFVSIVLFVTATSYSSLIKSSKSLQASLSVFFQDFDITCGIPDQAMKSDTLEGVAGDLKEISSVEEVCYSKEMYTVMDIPMKYLDSEYLQILRQYNSSIVNEEDETVRQGVVVFFIQDSKYQDYLRELKLDEEKYMDSKNWTALVWDELTDVMG